MELFNTFIMTNYSIVLRQHVSSNSLALTTNNIIRRDESSNIATITLCVQRLPGNVLIFAVYVRNMITSTSVHIIVHSVSSDFFTTGEY